MVTPLMARATDSCKPRLDFLTNIHRRPGHEPATLVFPQMGTSAVALRTEPATSAASAANDPGHSQSKRRTFGPVFRRSDLRLIRRFMALLTEIECLVVPADGLVHRDGLIDEVFLEKLAAIGVVNLQPSRVGMIVTLPR
ncbi:hypothetical protein [Jiella marina]|uniref:hypothetical protein n=1 Tax=Jiella sp. LLJ827 TaxID=2917712 RepID=UPI00210098F4|nr:hypothetical protein [Jiella sp. LLJ827]MCQ0989740.1 hypothetical protein [Jiella sp. LLJ827]